MQVKRVRRESARLLFSGFMADPGSKGGSWDVWVERLDAHLWRVEVDTTGFTKDLGEMVDLYDFDDAQLVDFAILSDLLAIEPYEWAGDSEGRLQAYFSGWVDTHACAFDINTVQPFARSLLSLALDWDCPDLITLACDFLCVHPQ